MKHVALILTVILCSGCGIVPGLNDVKLPGGPDLGADPRSITVKLDDTLNLAPQASVKVADVTVGTVEDVSREGWIAVLKLKVQGHVDLPANTVATIRQTGLLGEKYVELGPPAGKSPTGELPDDVVLGTDQSFRGVEVEEVLGSLSLLLNGGGLANVKSINKELHLAFEGRESEFKDLLTELDVFVTGLDDNGQALLDAIDGMDRLSQRVRNGKKTIDAALDGIGPALHELESQRKALVKMLQATARFGEVGGQTIRAIHEDLVVSLESLRPILTELVRAGDDVPQTLEFLLSYPTPENIEDIIRGDYANLDLDLELVLDTILKNETGDPEPLPPRPELPLPLPELPEIPGLPEVLQLPDILGLPQLRTQQDSDPTPSRGRWRDR